MSPRVIEKDGVRYAEIIPADTEVDTSTFFSPADSSFQFGLLAHSKGFIEPAHTHHRQDRHITDVQQMFVVQKGKVAVDFFTPDGTQFESVTLHPGDAIVLVDGAHAIRALEDFQCVSVKQGPFLGDAKDKDFLKTE